MVTSEAEEVIRDQIVVGLLELYSSIKGSHLLKVFNKERHDQMDVLGSSLRLQSE